MLKLNMEKGKNLRKELSLLKAPMNVWETTNTQNITNDYREIEWNKNKTGLQEKYHFTQINKKKLLRGCLDS